MRWEVRVSAVTIRCAEGETTREENNRFGSDNHRGKNNLHEEVSIRAVRTGSIRVVKLENIGEERTGNDSHFEGKCGTAGEKSGSLGINAGSWH